MYIQFVQQCLLLCNLQPKNYEVIDSKSGCSVRNSQRNFIANAEAWVDHRLGPCKQISLRSQSHIFIARSCTSVGEMRAQCHCVTRYPPYSGFRSLAVYQYLCNVGWRVVMSGGGDAPIQIIELVNSEAILFKYALGCLQKRKICQSESKKHFLYSSSCKLIRFVLLSCKSQKHKTRIRSNSSCRAGSMS